jgi:hypothetical protein
MILGHMIAVDEDALTCDLMETYHLANWQDMPANFVATLAIGLSDSSRIKKKISETKLTFEQGLLALLVDAVRINNWLHTKDAQKKRNMPPSIYKKLMGIDDEKNKTYELRHFDSIESFEEWHRQRMEK